MPIKKPTKCPLFLTNAFLLNVLRSLIYILSLFVIQELAELLRRHSDANVDMDIIGTGSGLGSVGTASAESSPPSPPQMNGCYGEDDDNGLYIDEDADEDRESNIPFGEGKHNGSSDRGKSCGGKFLKGNQGYSVDL
jgi:hypothetical protein